MPGARTLLAYSVIGRLPIGLHGLALVLLVRDETGSYATAGAVAAGFAAGAGIGAPANSRAIDRRGRALLAPLAVVHALAMGALLVLAYGGGPAVALVALAAVAGLGMPPISSVVRSLWRSLLRSRPELANTAFALEGVLMEANFTVGPLLVAAAAAAASPGLALGAGIVLVAVGTAGMLGPVARAIPVAAPDPPPPGGSRLGALAAPGLRTIVLVTAPMGLCFGAMEVALPAFADAEGHAALAGLLVAVWSLGSLLGGLAYGARVHTGPVGQRYARLGLLLPAGYLPLAAAPSIAVMLALVLLAGLCIAPLLTAGYQLAGDVAPPGALTEAMAWPVTALVVGIAAGNAAAGAVVEAADVRAAFGMAAAAALAGGVVAVARRGTLAA